MDKNFEIRINKLNDMIAKANHIVIFTGAGISTNSGLPDFRGENGLYEYNPEEILSVSYLKKNPMEFFKFVREHMDFRTAIPNEAHKKLLKWKSTKILP